AKTLRHDWTRRLEEQGRNLQAENEERKQRGLLRTEADHTEKMARFHQEGAARAKQLETVYAENVGKLDAARQASRTAVEADWRTGVLPLVAALQAAGIAAEKHFPPWRAELWRQFTLADEFAHATRFAELVVDLEKFCEVSLEGKGLAWLDEVAAGILRAVEPGCQPGGKQPSTARGTPAPTLTVPLLLSVPRQASLLFETKQSGQEQVIGALNNLVLRLLTSSPPGRLAFTIFDPVGLGQNFAGIMHLADFEERLINSRIWTQQAQFEQRLADLNEHIEKVTQMYLRNEYETLTEYNAQAGRMAEKYHFLVIADFPANFSDVAVKRLLSIAASGPRCGVHLL
ncbi:MAG TPA: hypothetical protein VNM37_06955, partial [Candidatus Dormibacteraeota bacterium]|nr:hypothetical protein [Candidatus Dormibacteraeota bacterium]